MQFGRAIRQQVGERNVAEGQRLRAGEVEKAGDEFGQAADFMQERVGGGTPAFV